MMRQNNPFKDSDLYTFNDEFREWLFVSPYIVNKRFTILGCKVQYALKHILSA